MNKELLDQVIQILLPILATILTTAATYIGNKIKDVYQTKLQNETAKTIVDDTVKYIQQVYSNYSGEQKLQKAIDKAQEVLASKGINLTDVEINMLIESSVYTLKNILVEPKIEIEEKKKLEE